MTQTSVEEVKEAYGAPNPSPSKYEQKLRKIFDDMKCSSYSIKNKQQSTSLLEQAKTSEASLAPEKVSIKPTEKFTFVKHPD